MNTCFRGGQVLEWQWLWPEICQTPENEHSHLFLGDRCLATAVVKTREMSTPQKQASVLAFRGGCLAMVMIVAGETSKPTKTSLNAHFWVVAGGHLVEA